MAREDERARYREAAQLALNQLDWCVEYFRSIHKPRIAQQLARNHAAISRRIQDGADGSRIEDGAGGSRIQKGASGSRIQKGADGSGSRKRA
jgi:hypothetical protein